MNVVLCDLRFWCSSYELVRDRRIIPKLPVSYRQATGKIKNIYFFFGTDKLPVTYRQFTRKERVNYQ